MKRRILLCALALVVALPLAGALWQRIATDHDRSAYPPPGELVRNDGDGTRLHLQVQGRAHREREPGAPVVLLDAGLSRLLRSMGVDPAGDRAVRHCRVLRPAGDGLERRPAGWTTRRCTDHRRTRAWCPAAARAAGALRARRPLVRRDDHQSVR